jgi:NADH-quinone oxidoreductase subunit J
MDAVIRFVFGIISLLGVLMALGTVLARNLVHAALFLVAFFFLVACQFVLLEAEFMAAIQVLVYIGAIAILLLFGIMLTRNIQGDETTGGHWIRKIPAAVVVLGLLAILCAGIAGEKGSQRRPAWSTVEKRPDLVAESSLQRLGPRVPTNEVVNNMSRTVGIEMMTRFGMAFEVAGLLLTAAVVGAIALAQSESGEDESPIRPGAVATVQPASGPNGSATPGSPKPAPASSSSPASVA